MNLRDLLRTGTRRAQDSAEAAYRRFDLKQPESLAGFLTAQRLTFEAMWPVATDPGTAAALSTAIAQIRTDMTALGHQMHGKVPPLPSADEELAQGYVWHSTRLGVRLLARDWQDATDANVRSAGRYLSAPRDSEGWRALCARLEEIEGYGALPDRVLTAANAWFVLYETVAHDQARRLKS
ncbi:hypothetical protein [Jannaschia pohangensis]|uniref:Heme oxygenase n=1 Tax=Jannaschia pohangensis TaxID=390807 RepID=A0A1I3MAZ7_9RHOB|nr:hypothetical protein [Jannaschia pohangensis]SFI93886.1 hypothetical protein SAMN04488095_1783 [Jannaschia pohangensis]